MVNSTVMGKKYRRGIHDRNDARYLKDLDSMHVMMPFIMPKRADNEAVLGQVVDITALNGYLEKKNSENPEFKYTWFQVIVAALAKTIALRPKMNWFIRAGRFFERNDVEVSFVVRRQLEDDSEEALAKFVLDRDGGSVLEQVHSYVQDFVTKVRVKGEIEDTTSKMNVLKKLPHFVLKIVFWALDTLDYFGIYPNSLKIDDPRFTSVFVSNLGSIRMNADYHHLYEKGTVSFFTVINERKMRPFFKEDGTYEMKDTIKIGMTIDERIADGYYFAKTLKLFQHLLNHPELLELPASEPVISE